ncbi:hypothetical protein [Weissella paramesenteroides]|jgi:hypothetical protein|uniref:Tetratricopeptide repeat protein n=1 Tax=Weissella paramesenteroides TaxID=1249 RepID=A0ABD4XL80_WEIPA|nr:hypothetical protein [Weissella paramesenteroides]MDF8367888.1 hypothetical protein [Weissella paramesenteroides]MDF8369979.1 hypothetical protein [Weissella paramesenteroides]MDF8371985.1 hypothetical protein [Weissella paramesenteroides]MDF8373963.1 hypothetical protein [Weissella paramesenteroides]WIG66506.1 hypothetical protein G9U56_05925 [Weissella paramesenteroides]
MTSEQNTNERYSSLVLEAKEEINNGSLSRALDTLTLAYQLRQTVEVNHLLVTTLIAQGQYQEAQIIADEYLTSYAKEEQSAKTYLNLALHNHYFLNAWEFLTWLPERLQDKFRFMVVEKEDHYRLNQEKTIQTIARQFYHLSDGDMIEQQKRLLAANKLPLSEYEIGAKFVLRDPFLSQISRTTVLDELRRVKTSDSVEFMDLKGNLNTYIPAELKSLEQDQTYVNILKELDKYTKKLGPDMVHGLREQVHLLLMIAYPQLSIIVQDVTSWVAGLVAETFEYAMPDEPDDQVIWRNKLQNSLMNLIN